MGSTKQESIFMCDFFASPRGVRILINVVLESGYVNTKKKRSVGEFFRKTS